VQGLLHKLRKTKPTGITCEYCGWNGESEDLHKAKVLNTDGTPYEIRVCPDCLRNGGLIDHITPKN
jgi:hypothetical protein